MDATAMTEKQKNDAKLVRLAQLLRELGTSLDHLGTMLTASGDALDDMAAA